MANQLHYPAPQGPAGAPFADVNLKLAVLSALDEQGTIALGEPPKLAEHLLGRSFDVATEGYRLVPEVLDYLARYPLDSQKLATLETLNLDGGSTIYHHIWHFWHGEDDTFEVASLGGIENCANLRELGVAGILSPVDIGLLTPLRQLSDLYIGTGVSNIAALRDLPALASVRILNDDIYAEVMTLGHPTRQLMDELKRAGITVWVHWVSHYDQPPAFE
ncbi:hypothetical protein XW59_018355 [Aquamicrobium sp. LC103]|nr:hypothetical protein XW59_018355 [Aquamicrobium sp. LC103]